MADKDKPQEKSKSSFFRSKSDGKKGSKKNKNAGKRRGSKGANAEDICENVKGLELQNVKENLTKPNTSKTDFVSSKSSDEIQKGEEASVSSATTDLKIPDDLETNLELEETSTSKLVGETDASSQEQHATEELSENAETSAVLDGKEHPDTPELTAVVEQVSVSGERGESQDASLIEQTEADVENKANEVTVAGGSKKHGKTSGPLASFRRHKKKNKLSKHSQDVKNVEKSEGKLNESKESDHSGQLESVENSAVKTTEAKIEICKEGEEQNDSSENSNSAVKAVELKEKTAEIPEKIASSGSEMVNEKSEEHGTTKKANKERKSGPFASFRKSKKKADSAKQASTSGKNGESKAEDPGEAAKEIVAVNVTNSEKENVLVPDEEMTAKQQQTSDAEQHQSTEPESNIGNLPAQESKATEEKNLNDEMSDDEKHAEDKPKKGKRFGSFSSFRAKKAPKLSQQNAQPQPQVDSKLKDTADSSSKEQTDGKSNAKDNSSANETPGGDDTSQNSKNKELATAEICKDLPSGSELQVPEVTTGTGSETNTAEEQKQQQDELDTTPEKKKSGLKKRISKLRLHSGKNKENQSKEGAKNQPEDDIKGKKSEAEISGSEISKQVKRKKSGGLQKKISKALKRNKSGQMEMNELYDDPSASEEECHPLLDEKNPISPPATETKGEINETDGKEKKDQINESPDKDPEVFEEKEEQPIAEQSSSSISGTAAAVVKRVKFSLDEETTETEDGEVSSDQPATILSSDEQQTTENTADQETEQDEKRDKDGMTLSEEDSVTSEKESIASEVYGMCRDIMKQVFVELFEYVATKMSAQQMETENRELKTDEDLPKPKNAPEVEPSSVTLSVVQEMDSGNLIASADALSIDSLLSTGTVVVMESSDSELERVSPIPDEFVSESAEFDHDSDRTEKPETFPSTPDVFVSESVDRDNKSEPQQNQTKKTPEKLEEEAAENEETTAEQPNEKLVQDDDATEVPRPSESNGSEDTSQKHGEDSVPSSEVVEPENDPTADEDKETKTGVPETEVSCTQERGEVDRAAETSAEESIERNLERSLERSLETNLQCLLSQSLKEEWIIVKPRLEVSQEMPDQYKAFALDSYVNARPPVCCKMM